MATLPSSPLDKDIQDYVRRFGQTIASSWYSPTNEDILRQRLRKALKSGKPDPTLAEGEDNVALPMRDEPADRTASKK